MRKLNALCDYAGTGAGYRFLGSPTLRINGFDVEHEARTQNSFDLGCRTYLDGSQRYRPYFLLGAVIALGFAARCIFRPASACKPGEACVLPKTRHLYKRMFGITVLLVLVACAFPYVARFFY
ncbi:mercuric transporter MerT family protein [Edaphobacter aggregans]|uniref:mercuric transporter MerT family protein n=1 Tax=Edaphobacter aggregans TaxID=570835 RepID=UPI000A072CC8